jgi:hypothetical protein
MKGKQCSQEATKGKVVRGLILLHSVRARIAMGIAKSRMSDPATFVFPATRYTLSLVLPALGFPQSLLKPKSRISTNQTQTIILSADRFL